MVYASLGTIEFDLISWASHGVKHSVDYAKHPLIFSKPRLEAVADNLMEISVELQWHAFFTNPATQMARLRDGLYAKQPLALVFGGGDYQGYFVITEAEEKQQQTTGDGFVIASGAKITLLEYVGLPQDTSPALAVRQAGAPLAARFGPPANLANPVVSLASQAARFATEAKTALRLAQSSLALIRALRTNPLAALGQVQGVANQLGIAYPAATGLQSVLGLLNTQGPGGVSLLLTAQRIATSTKTAITALRGAQPGNVSQQVGGAVTAVGAALAGVESLSGPIATWTLNNVLRKG